MPRSKLPWQYGGVPEWLKGTDCKSVGSAYVGSNPTPSTTAPEVCGTGLRALAFGHVSCDAHKRAGVAQW
jgi:hypothetical protein